MLNLPLYGVKWQVILYIQNLIIKLGVVYIQIPEYMDVSKFAIYNKDNGNKCIYYPYICIYNPPFWAIK